MADAGYDVWMPNQRGNFYSRRNLCMDPDDPASAFWNFSWDDIGIKDFPPIFDYICDATNQPKLYVIAHSQGSTSMIAFLAEKPEYNDRIHALSLMAPVTFLNHAQFFCQLALNLFKFVVICLELHFICSFIHLQLQL